MAFGIYGAGRSQGGLVQFEVDVVSTSIKKVSWRDRGSSLELWVTNNGNQAVELSFDGGTTWWPLPAGGIDIYRQKMVELRYRRATSSGTTTLKFIMLTFNPSPKPELVVGQKDDGKVRS